MSGDVLLMALGLLFVFEGLLPLAAPSAWRRAFTQLLQLQDGQIRFVGLLSLLVGLSLILLMV